MIDRQDRWVGMGCMRLSTSEDRQDAVAVATLVAAIDAGVTLFDTADAYGLDDADAGHNERLVARARAQRPDAAVTVVTKGGLTRPGRRWVPDGRAVALAAAARASRARLTGDADAPIDLYVLHAVDPAVPLATSVRALARLREEGVVRAIGVGNVNRTMLEAALEIAPIAAVEVELSPWQLGCVRGGLLALCVERGIHVLAHRPLGGVAGARRLARDFVLQREAARVGVSPAELALAWLRMLAPVVVPLPGATTVATAQSAARAQAMVLDDDARAALDRRFERHGPSAAPTVRPPDVGDAGEVVILMGLPAAGKTTQVAAFVERGHVRLNRDTRGGSLDALARALDETLAAGQRHVVLDNTYPSRASRAPVIAAARRHGVAARCVLLDTSLEDAQVNAVIRMLERHGRLLEPDELKRASKQDPGLLPPGAQFRWRRAYEPPRLDEGFASVTTVAFARAPGPAGQRALIVELDDLIRAGRPTHPDDVVLRPGAGDALRAWRDAGWRLVATCWAPAIAEGLATADAIAATAARTRALLGDDADLDIVWCPHGAGPPVCWCRKPLPGLGLVLARRHGLALARSVHLGRGAADRGFAARLGARFIDAGEPGASLPGPP